MPRLASRIDKKTYYGMNILDYLVGNIEKILLNKKLRDYPQKVVVTELSLCIIPAGS